MGRRLVAIDSKSRVATFFDGSRIAYETLLSSIPLNVLLKSIRDRPDVTSLADRLVWSSTRLLGLGLQGDIPEWLRDVHSFHLPDPAVPFWRLTFPAAFSPGNVPLGDRHWSILCESSEPRRMSGAPDEKYLAMRMENTLIGLGILPRYIRVLSRWYASIDHGYPTPFLGRDVLLAQIQNRLQCLGVYSRGRFGGWRYEISNQDDSFMQGVEVVNKVLLGIPETIYTFAGDKLGGQSPRQPSESAC
jgi:protoporphyrinogen oxidase